MNGLRAIPFVICLLAFALPVSAADITLTWTNATQNTDGTNIPTDTADPSSLATTTIFWSACGPGDTVTKTPGLELTVPTTVPGNSESAQVVITTPGRWCFVGVHTNLAGETSDDSGIVFREVLSVPNPPENLTVQEMTVFYVIQRENRFALLPVGTIPTGTECISTEYVNGYYAVDRNLVTWTSNTQPLVVVAQCG